MAEAAATTENAVTVAAPSSPVPSHLQLSPTLALYERAIRDPSIDLDRLERIADRLAAEKAQQREQAFYAALSSAQQKMRKVVANKSNSQTHSQYASYDALDSALRPIYTDHGFGVTYDTDVSPKGEGFMRVFADVTHKEGYKRQYKIDMPIVTVGPQGKAVMTPTHATGSAYKYGQRYLLVGIFNIAVTNDPTDDDGNAAGDASGPITAEQVAELSKLISDSGTKMEQFLAYGKVEKLEEIPARQFASAKTLLEQKLALKKQKERNESAGAEKQAEELKGTVDRLSKKAAS